MQKNAEKMDLSCHNRLLQVPAGSHGFWAHDLLPDLSHDLHVDPQRVTIPLTFTRLRPPQAETGSPTCGTTLPSPRGRPHRARAWVGSIGTRPD